MTPIPTERIPHEEYITMIKSVGYPPPPTPEHQARVKVFLSRVRLPRGLSRILVAWVIGGVLLIAILSILVFFIPGQPFAAWRASIREYVGTDHAATLPPSPLLHP